MTHSSLICYIYEYIYIRKGNNMSSHNKKLDHLITLLLISLTCLAYIPKIFATPNTPYLPLINSFVALVNLSVLFSSNMFEKLFHNKFANFFFALLSAFIIFIIFCQLLSSTDFEMLLNITSFLSFCFTFYGNSNYV